MRLPTHIAELCKGSTTASGAVCLGSNPSSAAIYVSSADELRAASDLLGCFFIRILNENHSLTFEAWPDTIFISICH